MASVVNIPLEDLSAWRDRLDDLTGVSLEGASGYDLAYSLGFGFRHQPFPAVARWQQRYGVTHVITTAVYPLPVLFRSGDTRVYQVNVRDVR